VKHIALFALVLVLVAVVRSGGWAADDDSAGKRKVDVRTKAKRFLARYYDELAKLEKTAALAEWKSENTGEKADFDASAEAQLALKKLHSNARNYKTIGRLLDASDKLDALDARALQIAKLGFESNQLPPAMQEELVKRSTEIAMTFNTYRAKLGGKEYTNNDLLEMLAKETDSERREAMWAALKQVGDQVGPKLVELAKLRNKAAAELGYANFWEMKIRLQEHEPERLLAIFAELEKVTDEPFRKMKQTLDGELARRFGIKPEAMRPWHYDNPFFQAAPPSEAIDLDEFYKDKKKEDITELAREFFADVGLPIDEILARSDLYEREGKSQHAFCISIDRGDDVRTLCNLKPTANWMDTMLHEQGHAVYDVWIDRSLPYNLRGPGHIFATEGVAMLFGALAQNPTWLIGYADADEERVKAVQQAVLEQRRREQLIFARWTMVMLNFEKALYEDPTRDLNALWWDHVERYQMLTRPADRDAADWAAKPHFTIAPVYYHNYMLGELFAAQMRHSLADLAGHDGPTATLSFNGRKQFGTFLKEKVFKPGKAKPWPEFVQDVTGEEFTVKYYAEEIR